IYKRYSGIIKQNNSSTLIVYYAVSLLGGLTLSNVKWPVYVGGVTYDSLFVSGDFTFTGIGEWYPSETSMGAISLQGNLVNSSDFPIDFGHSWRFTGNNNQTISGTYDFTLGNLE